MAVNPAPGRPPGAESDDPESPDAAAPLDLSPTTQRHAGAGRRRSRGRTLLGVGLLVVIVGGLGVVLLNGLNDAATFFYNVDEAVAKQPQLEGQRFRMQGNVVPGSVRTTPEGVSFVITYHGERVDVDHTGDPPELFGPDIPVVLEGTFRGDRFESDQILIRHDNEYDEKNPDRVRDAERDAQRTDAAPSTTTPSGTAPSDTRLPGGGAG